MNMKLRKSLAVLLGAVLLLSALPVAAAAPAAGGSQLYSWTASTAKQDAGVFSSNLLASASVDVRWNENAVMYTQQGKETVSIHNFRNHAAGRGSSAYGLPVSEDADGTQRVETLKVDLFPVIKTSGVNAIDLSFVYAYKPDSGSLNPANSGLLQVYVSKNGMDWLGDTVGIRSARVLGSGTTQTGETVIYYEIHCEELMSTSGLKSGEYIRGVRIAPDGETGKAGGQFSLCGLTITGYESKAAFQAAVPAAEVVQETVALTEEEVRKAVVDAAANSQQYSELGRVMDAISLVSEVSVDSAAQMLDTAGIALMDGIADKATDSVRMIFTYMYERELLDPAQGEQILADYEKIETTQHLIRDMNTPQQMFRAYAKAQAGDLLLQVEKRDAHVYMVTKCQPVFLPDRISLDPNKSTITYLTLNGEKTQTFFDAYAKELFVPMVVSALTDGTAGAARVEAAATFDPEVRVIVTSSAKIGISRITVGDTAVTVNGTGAAALVCTDARLTQAVAALADGKHQIKVEVTSGLGGVITRMMDFEVEDGKAAAGNHLDSCPARAMTDVDQNAWYHQAVDFALTNGIMSGYSTTSFGPEDTLSRAMVVQTLYNKEGQPAVSGTHTYADVPAGQWFNNAILWGTQNGVMGGYSATQFGPDDQVTVEQIAVILWNYSGNPAFTGTADRLGQHSSWAANGLAWALENGILDNVPCDNVMGSATRAQAAQMLMNYLDAN